MRRSLPLFLFVPLVLAGCGGQGGSGPSETPTPTPVTTGTPLPPQAQECSGPTVKGIDVADGNGTIDWQSVKGAGISFAYIKATQGTSFRASAFAPDWAGAGAAGVLRGAYHFLDPTVDGVQQANWFLSVVGNLGPSDLPPALDIECPDGDPNCLGYAGGSGSAPATLIAQRAGDWISTVRNATGKTPVVYTYVSYFPDNGIDASGFGAEGLWIANYGVSCPADPTPWTASRFWQGSASGTVAGVSGQVDTDVYFGTIEELTAYAVAGS